jgi:hypothetical protein
MQENKENFTEEYKENLKHLRLLKSYGLLIILCLIIILILLIFIGIFHSSFDENYFLLVFIPMTIMFILLIPFIYHFYKGGICPNCKKHMDRGVFNYCRFCGVKLLEKK